MKEQKKIILLHHSTGDAIWRGGVSKYLEKLGIKGKIERWFTNYNKQHQTNFLIFERDFPAKVEYGWSNYPYDYYNIWVKNAGDKPYMGEPTLEMLTKEYDLIIFKHCFPVGRIKSNEGSGDIDSKERTIENYKLQYEALKHKMYEFQGTKFLIWTGAAMVKNKTNEEEAKWTNEFFGWVTKEWDVTGDNIFIWDFYQLETEGGLYMNDKYAVNANNSHPNSKFGARVAPLLCKRIVDVLNGVADSYPLTGE